MMFKIETLVKIQILLFTVLLAVDVAAKGEAGPPPPPPIYQQPMIPPDPEKLLKLGISCDLYTGEHKTRCDDVYNAGLAQLNGNTQNCTSAVKEFKEARSAFEAACGVAKMHETAKDPAGNISCANAIKGCNNMEHLDSMRISKDEAKKPYNIRMAKDTAKKCPALLAKDLEKLRDDITAQEKSLKELSKEDDDAGEKANKSQTEARKEQSAIVEKANAEEERHNAKLAELAKNQDQGLADKDNQMVQLQAQIDTANTQIRGVEQARAEAQAGYEEQMAQVDLNCRARASAEVAKLQTDLAPKIATQQDLWEMVGISSREAWQREARRFYTYCLADDTTLESKSSALRARELKLKAAEGVRAGSLQAILGLQGQMAKVRSDSGCGGVDRNGAPTPESDTCKVLRQTQTDIYNENLAYQKKMESLNEEKITAATDANTTANLQATKVKRHQQEVEDEQTRLDNMREYYAIANQAAHGGAVDKDPLSSAFSTFGILNGKAEILATQPKCSDGESVQQNVAQKYLDAIRGVRQSDRRPAHVDGLLPIKVEDAEGRAQPAAETVGPPIPPAKPTGPEGNPDRTVQ